MKRNFATLMTTAGRVAAAILCLLEGSAHAGSFYFETAGGVARYQQDSSFFGAGANSTSGIGYAVNTGILVNFGSKSATEVNFGFQNRLSAVTAGSQNLLLDALYPVLRLQLSRVYLSFGATPLVWSRAQPAPGFDQIKPAKSSLAYLAETGVLWPITPEFSLGVSASGQIVNQSSAMSPKPALDATVLMRFYFGFFDSGGGHSSNEFKGWRYPFGMLR